MEQANHVELCSEERSRVGSVQVKRNRLGRISQGDIFRDVEYIEYVTEKHGIIEVSKIVFPLVVVLTQDCDLEQNARYRGNPTSSSDDKQLFSVLVAPLYNAEHVFLGTHLSNLELNMEPINKSKTPGKTLMQNEKPRYHYLNFPDNIPIVAQVVDFKHYFSVNVSYVDRIRGRNFICRISELYRENLSQRFAAYLARIGLPDLSAPMSGTP